MFKHSDGVALFLQRVSSLLFSLTCHLGAGEAHVTSQQQQEGFLLGLCPHQFLIWVISLMVSVHLGFFSSFFVFLILT